MIGFFEHNIIVKFTTSFFLRSFRHLQYIQLHKSKTLYVNTLKSYCIFPPEEKENKK